MGAAAFLPPGAYPWSLSRRLRATPAILAVLRADPRAVPGLMRLGANAERAFSDEPTWYLEVVGVHPHAQGQGVGTALLEPGLARADAERLPCHLETSRRENVRFYERRGFEIEREGVQVLPGGPTHWTMRRPPPAAR